MASSSGASSGSLRNSSSSSEEDLQQMNTMVDQRKRKRMLSNRESARRSRMKKQNHLEGLMAQLGQLRKENSEILTGMNITTQLYMTIEAENSVLRAQLAELSNRLDSLNEIVNYVNLTNSIGLFEVADQVTAGAHHQQKMIDDECLLMNTWSSFHVNSQPVMDMVMY
ncbi:hypothetical protein Tsubulata_000339 [Turnera subulata]|uniref:BZIP domain-containing protein n=1 Tax=Turnera subulata TaxID=218843 RepID=A0A9Q0IZL5_9ROSI|nr:hypothetical protein Tsubulata_000339 [Turnera subulata]